MRRTLHDSLLTRQAIVEAGLQVFARDGYGAATLEEVARQAGVTRGAIYWHFSGKGPLLQAILDEHCPPLEDFLGSLQCLEQGLESLRCAVISTMLEPRHQMVNRLILQKSEWIGPVALRLEQTQQRFREQLTALLTNARRRGDLAADLNIDQATAWLQASITGLLVEGLKRPQDVSTVDVTLQLFKRWLGGV